MYVLTGAGGGFSAGTPGARPIVDTRRFFSSGDIFSLGIAAGFAVILAGMITRRKVRVRLSKAARRYHVKQAARHRKGVERHSRVIRRSLPRDVQMIGKATKKSRRKKARITAAMDEDWLASL